MRYANKRFLPELRALVAAKHYELSTVRKVARDELKEDSALIEVIDEM